MTCYCSRVDTAPFLTCNKSVHTEDRPQLPSTQKRVVPWCIDCMYVRGRQSPGALEVISDIWQTMVSCPCAGVLHNMLCHVFFLLAFALAFLFALILIRLTNHDMPRLAHLIHELSASAPASAMCASSSYTLVSTPHPSACFLVCLLLQFNYRVAPIDKCQALFSRQCGNTPTRQQPTHQHRRPLSSQD